MSSSTDSEPGAAGSGRGDRAPDPTRRAFRLALRAGAIAACMAVVVSVLWTSPAVIEAEIRARRIDLEIAATSRTGIPLTAPDVVWRRLAWFGGRAPQEPGARDFIASADGLPFFSEITLHRAPLQLRFEALEGSAETGRHRIAARFRDPQTPAGTGSPGHRAALSVVLDPLIAENLSADGESVREEALHVASSPGVNDIELEWDRGSHPSQFLNTPVVVSALSFHRVREDGVRSHLLGGRIRFPNGEKQPIEILEGALLRVEGPSLLVRSLTVHGNHLELGLIGTADTLRYGFAQWSREGVDELANALPSWFARLSSDRTANELIGFGGGALGLYLAIRPALERRTRS